MCVSMRMQLSFPLKYAPAHNPQTFSLSLTLYLRIEKCRFFKLTPKKRPEKNLTSIITYKKSTREPRQLFLH